MTTGVAGEPDVIAFTKPRSPAAEAYRTLRTNLQFASLERPLRRLLLTSAGPDEGKSASVANLAVTMAQAEAKVIVVDCDLRRPAQHEIFHLRNTAGLTNLFLASGDRRDAELPLQPTAVPNLWVLTSGPLPHNPAELLGSPRMDAILERLADRADVVILDAPPVVPVTDAAVLAPKVDGVLLVVGAGTVKRDVARKAKVQLEAVNARVLGLVVTNVPFDAAAFGQYYESDESAQG
ncbi:MAG: CpsD/CapB family tyrosine-protein kinase [Chloroflexi bacterium]|nr:CpsD/CapB family tyrosine-protein kinase [Chloroflexota bacterium]